MITDLFYIIIFMSLIGSLTWALLGLIQRIFHIRIQFAFLLLLLFFFIAPIKIPPAHFIDPDPNHMFIPEFQIFSIIWLIGLIILWIYFLIQFILVHSMLKESKLCSDDRIIKIVKNYTSKFGIKKTPKIYYGKLKQPACVVLSYDPKIVLTKSIIDQLTDKELEMIILHEMVHIRHHHLASHALISVICSIHWFNPFVWFARRQVGLSCEISCDLNSIKVLHHSEKIAYANTLLRLAEIPFKHAKRNKNMPISIGVLTYPSLKKRIQALILPNTTAKKIRNIFVSIIIVSSMLYSAIYFSRSMFYPYLPKSNDTEYSEYVIGELNENQDTTYTNNVEWSDTYGNP